MKKFCFISGLPRAGSTLLANILAQNPRFHPTQTSGLVDVMFLVRNHWHQLKEHQAAPNEVARHLVMRGILEAYYRDVEAPIIFDKGRSWLAHIEMVEDALRTPVKILVPLRPISDVLSSMEKLHRETAKVKQPPGEAENYFQMQTVAGRCDYWFRPDKLVGLAYRRIHDALQRGFKDRLYFVDFDKLTSAPERTLAAIYSFLEEKFFQHDFDNVAQVTKENDDIYGYLDLHKIRPKVAFKDSDALAILGRELTDKYSVFDFAI